MFVFYSQQSYVTVGGGEKEEKTEDAPAKQDPSSKQVSVRVLAHVLVRGFFVTWDCDVVVRAF